MRTLILPILAAAPVLLAAAGPAAAQAPQAQATSPQGSIYVVTYVEVQAAAAQHGAALLRRYRDAVRGESGNLEAELGQEVGRSNRFVLIEGWRGKDEFDAHAKAAAAERFRDALTAIRLAPPDQRVNSVFDRAPMQGKGAFLVATHVDVIPPQRAKTEAALRAEAAASRSDPGLVRYDVFQQLMPLNHFNLMAVWRSEKDFAAHEAAAHRTEFRATLAPMLGALYDERLYKLM